MKTRIFCLAVIAGALYLLPVSASHAGTSFSLGISVSSVSDFYQPLGAYGSWVEVGDYGRCWRPAYIGTDWQPYEVGHWVWTDSGWYWESDEPWAWATYHYGRWVWDQYNGWVWVPDTVWGPSWVSWREGGGYYGWAPLPPPRFCGRGGIVAWEQINWAPRAFVFVEFRRFCEPIRHHGHRPMDTNRTFIHNTVNINNVTVINNTVINNAPHVDTVRQHVGDRLQTGRTEELWGRRSEQVTQRASQDRAPVPPVISRPVGSSDRPQRPNNTVAPSPRNDQATTPRVIASEPRREPVSRPSEAVRPAEPERQRPQWGARTEQRPETVVTSRPQTRPEPRVMPSNNAQPLVREQRPSWSSARQEPQAQPPREFRPSPQTSERQNSFSGAREQRPAPSANTWESRGNDSRDSDRRSGQTSDDSTRGRFVSRGR